MLTRAEKVFHEALASVSEIYPTSVLGDLLMLFPPEVVVKLVVTFAGDTVTFPKLNVVWNTYRAKVIKETLASKDDSVVRAKLARYFGISTHRVSEILCEEKAKTKRILDSVLAKSAKRTYRHGLDDLLKNVKDALGAK